MCWQWLTHGLECAQAVRRVGRSAHGPYHSIRTFLQMPEIKTVWVGVSAEAKGFSKDMWPDEERLRIKETGGATRHQTVLNTLSAMLETGISGNDWVLVHDAARPGLTVEAARRLIAVVTKDVNVSGGILAMPLADTLKMVSDKTTNCIAKTLPRDGLWLAQTPQMFRIQALKRL